MEVYKKSYTGFIVWLVVFCLAVTGFCFLPDMSTQMTLALVDNAATIGIFVLTFLIYQTEYVYWYNGTKTMRRPKPQAVSGEKRSPWRI